jgi:hypothetical protein
MSEPKKPKSIQQELRRLENKINIKTSELNGMIRQLNISMECVLKKLYGLASYERTVENNIHNLETMLHKLREE